MSIGKCSTGSSSEVVKTPIGKAGKFYFTYFPQLDGFRGLAIILVLIGHYDLSHLGPLGGFGVLCFFVLSGFLITGLLCAENSTSGNVDLRQFYLRRALRILPAFLVFLVIATVLIATHRITDVPWYTVLVSFLYLNNIFGRGYSLGHLWSLSLEEQFYALWPCTFKKLGERGALRLAAALVILISVIRGAAIYLKLFEYHSSVFYERPWFRFDSILIGCCIAIWLNKRTRIGIIEQARRWMHPSLLLPIAVMWTLWAERIPALRPFYLTIQMALAAAMLFHVVIVPEGIWSRFLSHDSLRFVGRISYSVYLWQQLFMISNVPDWGWIRVFPYNVIASIAVGIASHYLIERPFLRLKRSLAKPKASAVGRLHLAPESASTISMSAV